MSDTRPAQNRTQHARAAAVFADAAAVTAVTEIAATATVVVSVIGELLLLLVVATFTAATRKPCRVHQAAR